LVHERVEQIADPERSGPWPSVTLVFLAHNRREELRESLRRMTAPGQYAGDLELLVVDNASTDGTADMVRSEFPQVNLRVREHNNGVSGFNDGFALARGDFVLALDDDCYLEPGGLTRSIQEAEGRRADLVSFRVTTPDGGHVFTDRSYRTGLLSFWGCAALIRREVLEVLQGYDPEIFVWANELEFMLRFFDRGFRHLHLPEVEAIHMKETGRTYRESIGSRQYRINARHFAYIAGKLLRPREAVGALAGRLAFHIRDGIRVNPAAFRALPSCMSGFIHGLRRRDPVRNPEISRVYRHNFKTFASPWWVSRRPIEFIRSSSNRDQRNAEYFATRARYYPKAADTLEF
jgi:GT2 family glycosyltransferase